MLVDTPNDAASFVSRIKISLVHSFYKYKVVSNIMHPHRNVYSNSVLDVMGFSEPVAWF